MDAEMCLARSPLIPTFQATRGGFTSYPTGPVRLHRRLIYFSFPTHDSTYETPFLQIDDHPRT
jgi:hypothetical protein